LKSILTNLIARNTNRPVTFDESMPADVFLSYLLPALIGVVRGLIYFRRVVTIGSRCTIKNRRYVDLGSGTIIKDNCVIDGWGEEGLVIGRRSSIGSGSILRVSGSTAVRGKRIKIGENVGLSDYCHIQGGGGVEIGNDTICGPFVSFHPENHGIEASEVPIRKQASTYKGISVGRNCWIGAKSTLLDGCVVGDNCVVAAGSVVNRQFDSNVIIGGVPARVLRQRGQ